MNFKYCPNCGTKGSIRNRNLTHYVCEDCGWEFWNNPKAAVSVIFLDGKGRALFAKRAREPEKGKFDFPGGFLDYGEDPFEAAVREIKEETAVTIAVEDLSILAAYTVGYIPGVTAIDLITVVKKWHGTFKAADDVAALEWKPLHFIYDPMFRPGYPGLVEKLEQRYA